MPSQRFQAIGRLRHGEFTFASALPLDSDPEVVTGATYSYVAKSPAVVDVVCPAWSVRKLQELEMPIQIDLSLERGLATLQQHSGGFELTHDLVAALGIEDSGSVLAFSDDRLAEVFGALLVLKSVQVYKADAVSPQLSAICERAQRFASQHLHTDGSAIRRSLATLGTSGLDDPWPEAFTELLRSLFMPSGRWSFFDLWARLLPIDTLRMLREQNGILCPRFFLVDLASAPLSPYEEAKTYQLVRRSSCIFVGQPPASDDGGARDSMRQGRQLEAKVIRYGWLEEDHVLTEVVFPGVRAVFSAAPDGLVDDGVESQPLLEGSDEDYQAHGYSFVENFSVASGKYEQCRVWHADRPAVSPERYLEVKKTTHLHGRPGQFKRLKYWLQASLMRCGTVLVATTEGSAGGDVVLDVKRFSVDELSNGIDVARVWGGLAQMLQHIFAETSASDGLWTLRLQKPRGPYAAVRLTLEQGWVDEGDSDTIFRQIDAFFDVQHEGEESAGEPDCVQQEECSPRHIYEESVRAGDTVQAYWPDDDTWLPAVVEELCADGSIEITWCDDGSGSSVPADYVRQVDASPTDSKRRRC